MEDHLLVSESSDSDLVRASNKEDWEDTHRSGSSTDDDGPGEQVTSCSRYCINCTGQMGDEDATVCEDCGHHIDANLFDRDISSTAHLGSCNAKVALLYDERMELHEDRCSPPHPERPDRIRAVMARIRASGLGARCNRVTCREASISELAAVHTGSLIQLVQDASHKAAMFPGSNVSITPDTYVNQHTFLCARLAAGGAAQVAGMVARGEAPHGAAIVRPPGHHAESGMAMGFCFFNNAAVAARAAQAAGARRVVILDWDIHHGNGTQHIFEDDPSVLYMSLHRYDGGSFYPGTGAAEEAGVDEGEGFTVNVPWDSADMGNGDYLAAFHQVLVPIVYEYNPDLIIVSAGFDAADGDPIGECRVTPECFGHMTSMLKAVAPLVLLLEGGYNLHSTAVSTEACLRVLLGEEPGNLPGARYPSAFGCKAIQQALQVQSQYWKCLRHGATAGRWQQGRPHTDSLCANVGLSMELAAEPQPSETMQLSCKNGMASSAAGPDRDVSSPGCRRQAGGSPQRGAASGLRSAAVKRKMLVAIHKRAMRAFWKRQRRLANQLPAAC